MRSQKDASSTNKVLDIFYQPIKSVQGGCSRSVMRMIHKGVVLEKESEQKGV